VSGPDSQWKLKNSGASQGQQLKPVILATWEVEIERTKFQGQSGPKLERPHPQQVSVYGGVCIPAMWVGTNKRTGVQDGSVIK
jgi:hypothetical protein